MMEDDMAVSYKKLFHLLIEKNMTNAQLQQEAGFSANIITRLKRNGYISLESVESICRVLNCGVDDILEFVSEDNGEKRNGNVMNCTVQYGQLQMNCVEQSMVGTSKIMFLAQCSIVIFPKTCVIT